MKKYFYAALAFTAFTATAQTEIEPFAPSVPGTYIGDFEGIAPGADIPANTVFTEEGDTGGANNNWLGEDGTTTANFPGNIGNYAVAQCEPNQELYLISPEMDFGTNTGSPTLTFRYAIDNGVQAGSAGAFGNANLDVVYKESAGGAWTTAATYTTIDNTFHNETVDLSGAGSYATFYVAFRIYTVSPGGFVTWGYLAIDEVVIEGTDNSGCSNSTSSFTVDACGEYTVPSGDETYTAGATVMDTIQNVAGCDSIMTITVNVTTVDVSVSTTANVISAGAAGLAYQWIDCSDNSVVAGETGQTFTPSANGDYAVIVTDNGCSDTSACEAIVDLGLFDQDLGFIEVFPNPTQNALNVNVSNPEITQIQIWTLDGKLIQSTPVIATGLMTLDLSSSEKGTYLVQPVTESGQLKPILVVKN